MIQLGLNFFGGVMPTTRLNRAAVADGTASVPDQGAFAGTIGELLPDDGTTLSFADDDLLDDALPDGIDTANVPAKGQTAETPETTGVMTAPDDDDLITLPVVGDEIQVSMPLIIKHATRIKFDDEAMPEIPSSESGAGDDARPDDVIRLGRKQGDAIGFADLKGGLRNTNRHLLTSGGAARHTVAGETFPGQPATVDRSAAFDLAVTKTPLVTEGEPTPGSVTGEILSGRTLNEVDIETGPSERSLPGTDGERVIQGKGLTPIGASAKSGTPVTPLMAHADSEGMPGAAAGPQSHSEKIANAAAHGSHSGENATGTVTAGEKTALSDVPEAASVAGRDVSSTGPQPVGPDARATKTTVNGRVSMREQASRLSEADGGTSAAKAGATAVDSAKPAPVNATPNGGAEAMKQTIAQLNENETIAVKLTVADNTTATSEGPVGQSLAAEGGARPSAKSVRHGEKVDGAGSSRPIRSDAAAVSAPAGQSETRPLSPSAPAHAAEMTEITVGARTGRVKTGAGEIVRSEAALTGCSMETPDFTPATRTESGTPAADITTKAEAAQPRFTVEVPKPLQLPSQIRVRIEPAELGNIRIDLQATRTGIVGVLRFDHNRTRDMVERDLGQLHKALANAGVRVERLQIIGRASGDMNSPFHANTPNQDQQTPRGHVEYDQQGRPAWQDRPDRDETRKESRPQTAAAAWQNMNNGMGRINVTA